jgi:chemotaxis protein CheY-P-specific phosphatase CheC
LNGNLRLTTDQLNRLTMAFHAGARLASEAMCGWLAAPSEITIDSADECPLDMATSVLGQSGDVVGMCLMQMEGTLNGQMVLAFDDESGLCLSDLLIGRPQGSATEWGEVEVSSAQESMNILGSAYLNGMSRFLTEGSGEIVSLIPSPPVFYRDFAESLLQTVFVGQASIGNHVLFARARFELHGCPLNWTFLLIPDPSSLTKLSSMLSQPGSYGETAQ